MTILRSIVCGVLIGSIPVILYAWWVVTTPLIRRLVEWVVFGGQKK